MRFVLVLVTAASGGAYGQRPSSDLLWCSQLLDSESAWEEQEEGGKGKKKRGYGYCVLGFLVIANGIAAAAYSFV
ncbi:hypothetical protein ACS0TY_001488 [Phlomoides rotata]